MGKWGGRRIHLSTLPSFVRPTSNYAKEGLFNILRHSYTPVGKSALDLFSGTGSIGLEFLSVGAKSVVMVEQSSKMCSLIHSTLEQLQIDKQEYRLLRQDVFGYLNAADEGFDFIFADPPFKEDYLSKMLYIIKTRKLLRPQGLFIYECASKQKSDSHQQPSRIVSYGDTSFLLFNSSVFDICEKPKQEPIS